MTPAPTGSLGATSSPTVGGPSDPTWVNSNYCQVYPENCVLWGVAWQYLAISAALFVAAGLARFLMYPLFVLLGKVLIR